MSRRTGRVGLDDLAVAAIVATAATLRLATAGAGLTTTDEPVWMARADSFVAALANGDVGRASASPDGDIATMPGVTTMWLGAAARAVWSFGSAVGIGAGGEPAGGFASSAAGLDLAQGGVAIASSLLIGLVVTLAGRWVGQAAALITGAMLATEPFLVAHGAVLHTDELTALFCVSAFLASALALGVPVPTPWAGRRHTAALAGALFAGAVLTKMSALSVAPGIVGLLAWRQVLNRRAGEPDPSIRPLVRSGGGWFAGVALVAYPALWARPEREVELLAQSAHLGQTVHYQFFLGEVTPSPGIAYYLVTSAYRMSPWLLALSVGSLVVVWFLRGARPYAAGIALLTLPSLAVLSLSSKKQDRYGLLVIMGAALLVALALGALVREARSRALVGCGTVLAVASAAYSASVAPWGLAYTNPALTRFAEADEVLQLGWGEGVERVGPALRRLAGGDCQETTFSLLSGYRTRPSEDEFCGRLLSLAEPVDYVVIYVSGAQRLPWLVDRLIDGRRLVAEERIRGVPYLRVYGEPEPAERTS